MNKIFINKGKHAKNSTIGMTTGIIIIFIIVIIITLFIILKSKIQNQDDNRVMPVDISELENNIEPIVVEIEPTPIKQDEIISVDDMPKKMSGYDVIGKLVIEKIDLEKYVLGLSTDESWDISVAKLNGTNVDSAEINTVGNFCIAGHNYKKLFNRLRELETGDEFYLVSADGRKVSYVIYDKYSVNPKDPNCEECFNQDTNGKREVTLITCDPGAKTRLILKAEEKL